METATRFTLGIREAELGQSHTHSEPILNFQLVPHVSKEKQTRTSRPVLLQDFLEATLFQEPERRAYPLMRKPAPSPAASVIITTSMVRTFDSPVDIVVVLVIVVVEGGGGSWGIVVVM